MPSDNEPRAGEGLGDELATELDATGVDADEGILGDDVFLVLVRRDGRRVIEVADGSEMTFGRDDGCTVVLDEPRVSRTHFVIKRHGSLLVLQDLDSTNGTKLNGVALHRAERRIVGGDVIRVGHSTITVAAASGSGISGPASTSRLALELQRLGQRGEKATLLRVDLPPDQSPEGLERMAAALNTVALVEQQDEGQYAALLDTALESDVAKVVRELERLLPEAEVGRATFPADGEGLRALWQAADRQEDELPSELPQGVCLADPAMVKVFRVAQRVAKTDTTVLVLGETGSGKEVLAEQIHRHSARSAKPYVRLNCASLPETLLSSELFGHERGAFTGADRRKIGYFEAAMGGTLLLDEIGELSLGMQVKLLRVLENRTVLRLGATSEIPVDVRVICATHRDLHKEVESGRFREDLFYRVSAFTLTVPPLRERPTEIGLLSEAFLRQFAERMGRPVPAISDAAMAALASHRWPGNVRELRNAIEHAFVMCDGKTIALEHLPESTHTPDEAPSDDAQARAGGVRDKLEQIERASILKALADENGNQTRAAKRLGLSRRALIYKMAKYAIRRGR
jgi:DNA-binding NtrC family response regulator/pSer/pThr/pTyr-binding forkhead associated (FHA) protein